MMINWTRIMRYMLRIVALLIVRVRIDLVVYDTLLILFNRSMSL